MSYGFAIAGTGRSGGTTSICASIAANGIVPHRHPSVISIYPRTFTACLIVAVGTSDFGISLSGIKSVWVIVCVAHRAVIPSIRPIEYQTEAYGRSGKEGVKGPVHIMSVEDVDISGMVIVESPIVVVDVHIAHTTHPIAVISDIDITDLGDTSVMIIIDRYVFHLDYSAIIVILGIGTIIVPGVECHPISTARNMIVNIKIKFPIRIYRKRNAVLDKNKGVIVAVRFAFRNLILSGSCGQSTCGT